jgi:TraM recognition site of TraD and TraG
MTEPILNPRDLLRELEGRRGESATNMHVIGSPGLGKSKFLELLMREAIKAGRGFCFIDWHGKTYRDVLGYLAYVQPEREIVLLNPSEPEYVKGFNPFMDPGDDVSTTVARRIDAVIKSWGAANTDQTPTLEKTARMLFHFAIAAKETLPNAAMLLRFGKREVLDYAIRLLSAPEHSFVRDDLVELLELKNMQQWTGQMGSTKNRITRFVAPQGLRRFIGMKSGNVNIAELMERDAIVLVNLARSGYLDPAPAKVFAALLIAEFYAAAMKRAGTDKHYHLILDEFQEYVTPDIHGMLTGVRKGGLHMTLAHQNLAQLGKTPELTEAVLGTCLLKVIFGGLSYESAAFMAQEVYLNQINERMIDETFDHLETTGYELVSIPTESRTVTQGRGRAKAAGNTTGSSAGQADRLALVGDAEYEELGITQTQNMMHGSSVSESASETDSLSVQKGTAFFLLPQHTRAVTGRATRSRDEKVSLYAAMLKDQPKRHATFRLRNTTYEAVIPNVKDWTPSPETLKQYERELYEKAGALPAAEVDQLLIDSERDFLRRIEEDAQRVRKITKQPPKKEKAPVQAGPHEESPWPEGAEKPLTSKTKPSI